MFNIKGEKEDIPIKKIEESSKQFKLKLKNQYKENEPTVENNPDEIKEDNKLNLEQQESPKIIETIEKENKINLLFLESETEEEYKEKWIDLYEKALQSDKNTMTNKKVRNGKFRFNSQGQLEILADFKTVGKSSKDLLKEVWNENK